MKALAVLLVVAPLLLAGIACAQQTTGSCIVFPKDNPWNQDVSKLPPHPMSATWINTYGPTRSLHPDWGSPRIYGIPFETVGATQPLVPIEIDPLNGYPDQSDPGPWPIPLNARVEGDSTDPNYEDHHVLVVDTDHCMLYELYHAVKNAAGTGWTVFSSAKFDLNRDDYRPDGWTSCDAAGLPIFPGLVRYEEVMSGEIRHAIRFTVNGSQPGWIHPARHQAGSADATHMPMGARVRLKATADLSTLSGGALVIAHAMQKYGIILADNGSNWFLTGATDSRWDDNNINLLKNLHGSDLEAVYTGPTKTSEETGAGILVYGDSIAFTVPKSTNGLWGDSLTIVNTGNSDLTISSVLSQDFNVSPRWPHTIPAGTSAMIAALVAGPLYADINTNFTIASNAAGRGIDTVPVHVHVTTTGVEEAAPGVFALAAYPNPFSAHTDVSYNLPTNATVSLAVYNAMGVNVQTITPGMMAAGAHVMRLDATSLPDGVYFYTLHAGMIARSAMLVVRR